jgi:hypothetical protein
MSTDTPKAKALLDELERIMCVILDPNDPDIGGRKDTYKYEVLPNLLRSEVGTIIKTLRVYCGEPEPEPKKAPADDGQLSLL